MEPPQQNNTTHQLQTPEDYRKAIAALDASTQAIESQISITQRLLDSITTTTNPKQQQNKSKPTTTLSSKHQALSAQISSQHSVLAQNLTSTSANLKKAISSTLVTVDDTLSRDDYVFGQIAQGLRGGSERASVGFNEDGYSNDDDEEAMQTRTEKLLDALVRTESEVIRTRLERVYLEVLSSSDNSTFGLNANGRYIHHDDDDDLDINIDTETDTPRYIDPTKTEILKADLRTLYTEIDDVTALFVAHEHGDSLIQLDAEVARVRQVLSARQCEWAVERIREMTGRLRVIEDGLRGVQGQRVVIRRLSGYLEEFSVSGGGVGRGGGGGAGGRVESSAMVRKEADGPALVGLRGYLGVGAGGESRGNRIDEVFRDVKRGVEGVLEVQGEQARMLKRVGGQEEDDVARGYGGMLDGLDEEIARVKDGIESLPG